MRRFQSERDKTVLWELKKEGRKTQSQGIQPIQLDHLVWIYSRYKSSAEILDGSMKNISAQVHRYVMKLNSPGFINVINSCYNFMLITANHTMQLCNENFIRSF
ncbi:hypothetical protein AMECASPLE_032688 [Ameca splendens]|uniref:Uncharacterized protein n=1 Tax=Ameca splendens TaxID=208324 RepID=A0ABV0ZGS0_9TELE